MSEDIVREQKAVRLCEENASKLFVYTGPDLEMYGKTGYFEIIHDMTGCAPTDSILFCFQTKKRRFVMDAAGLIDTFEHSTFV